MRRFCSALALVVVVGLLAACTGPRTPTEPPPTGSNGADSVTLRIGALGNNTDTFDPMTTQGFADYIGLAHVYGGLVALTNGEAELDLAESIEPNETGDIWTITVKADLTFSDGSPVLASDVAYSLRTLADPGTSPNYSQFYADLDADGITVIDDRTVEVPLKRPRADFLTTVMAFASFVMKEGATDWQDPIGSGRYTLTEYHAGERIVLTARDDLGDRTPQIDVLDILIINDPQARMNALQSGQIDFATRIDPLMARTIEQTDGLAVQQGGTADSQILGLEMNVTIAPFDDPRVREAMRLAIDRQALVDTILLGVGTVANDIVGLGLPGYHTELPQRPYDPDRARELFTQAGVTELTIRASDTTPGMVDSAALYADQLAKVGVTVHVEEVDPATFFSDFDVLLNTGLQTSYYITRDAAAFLGSFTGSFGYFNISGYNPAGYDDAVRDAQGEPDASARAEKFLALQEMQWSDGGMILWGYQPVLNGQAERVSGVTLAQGVPQFGDAILS